MTDPQPQTWLLEGFTDKSRRIWRTPLDPLPFEVGRSTGCQLFLDSPSVSQKHARVFGWRDELRIVDLGSTNGTFVNGRRLEAARTLADGDVLQFADWEFRLVARAESPDGVSTTEVLPTRLLSPDDPDVTQQFLAMVKDHALWAVFQPIVRLDDRSVVAYEALGRGSLGGVETSPTELFALAEDIDRAAELSHIFRRQQLRDAASLPGDPEIFLNTHPAELRSARTLVDSLERLDVPRGALPPLCIELNEAAASDLSVLHGLREKLAPWRASFAFDDFGTGHSRLLELADVGPSYVKFDRAWIEGLDRATEGRLELMRTLLSMVRRLGVAPIAEGVELREEAEACAELGFELAQGFFLGLPKPASRL